MAAHSAACSLRQHLTRTERPMIRLLLVLHGALMAEKSTSSSELYVIARRHARQTVR